MTPSDRPKMEHKPYRKPPAAPGGPAAASKPPRSGQGAPPKPKPRKRPLEAEIRDVVAKASADWLEATLAGGSMLLTEFVIKAITKRLHGCHVPARKRDKVAKRLPKDALYVKRWDGEQWGVELYVPTGALAAVVQVYAGDTARFHLYGPGSFLTEQNVDKLYRKWKREQEGPK